MSYAPPNSMPLHKASCSHHIAVCLDCGKQWLSANALSVAARHHRASMHRVVAYWSAQVALGCAVTKPSEMPWSEEFSALLVKSASFTQGEMENDQKPRPPVGMIATIDHNGKVRYEKNPAYAVSTQNGTVPPTTPMSIDDELELNYPSDRGDD